MTELRALASLKIRVQRAFVTDQIATLLRLRQLGAWLLGE